MKKSKKKKRNEGLGFVRVIVVVIVLAALMIGFYYYISHMDKKGAEDEVTITKSQQVLMRNLDANYPATPKEVIKYYCEIIQCFYNETHTEEEVEALATKIRGLYDADLIANQDEESYLESVKVDILSMAGNGMTVSSYGLPSSTDVEYFSKDGREWAKMYCNLNLRQETKMFNTIEQFLLRKDENGRWKIYGWKLID
ncbi:MAG: hypothetical protein HFI03_09680 [Lachnospiraceae bacterium]|jgi:ABC-type Na+ efflux pump permease subunit|nr:hypothetical protein [Lachnospiraceae bacterium]